MNQDHEPYDTWLFRYVIIISLSYLILSCSRMRCIIDFNIRPNSILIPYVTVKTKFCTKRNDAYSLHSNSNQFQKRIFRRKRILQFVKLLIQDP